MRLTLRTLLAYIDDRLPPVHAKEIGQKINNSAFATELLERIREVKRKRRIASAQDESPVLDANLIAEYLDDQLPPEIVARLEQKILASDALLAEVASSHELLGMLRDPVTLEPRLRDRLYALGPKSPEIPAADENGSALTAATTTGHPWKPPVVAQPGRHRRPLLIATALAAIWLISLLTDTSLFQSSQQSNNDSVAVSAPEKSASPAEGIGVPQKQPNQPEAAEKEIPIAVAGTENIAANGESTTSNLTPPPDTTTAVAAKDKTPLADMPDSGSASANVAADLPVDAADSALPPVFLQADSRTIFVADPGAGSWTTLNQIPGGDTIVPEMNVVNCSSFLKDNWFAVAEPFQLKMRVEGHGWLASVPGPSLLRLPGSPRQGLSLLSGRMVLTVDPAVAWQDQQKPMFDLYSGESITRITLNSPETRIAIAVTPKASKLPSPLPAAPLSGDGDALENPPKNTPSDTTEDTVEVPDDKAAAVARKQPEIPADGVNQPQVKDLLIPENSDLSVVLTVLEGSASLSRPQSAEPGSLDINAGTSINWTVVEANEASSPTLAPSSPSTIPQWMLQPDEEPIPEAAAVRNRLIEALAAPGAPSELVASLTRDRNPQLGMLAVHVLAVTRDVDQLLAVLFEPVDELVHRVAIDGLQSIASGSASGHDVIEKSLGTRLPMAEAKFVMQLIEGLSPAQAEDHATSTALVQLLSDERLAIRTIAIYRIENLTGDRHTFYPAAEPTRRRDAIRRLQKSIERHGGTLVP
ncbi:MAG: hypothetical protein WCK86_09010 [Planctomycetia bacterium]